MGITVQRQERKRGRKAAKRAKVKARLVRQQREAHESTVEQERVTTALRTKRHDDAQEAIEQLQARYQRRQLDGLSSKQMETTRVRLVKQQRVSPTAS